ncbi:MAG: GSCFA domain-containing protein [Cyclobacteriaceae bacterium]
MEFRTTLDIKKSTILIKPGDAFLTIGSCFADHLGNQLQKYKFNGLINPFGTAYNPISIHSLIQYAINNTPPADDTFGSREGMFFNFDFHSTFSHPGKDALHRKIEAAIRETHLSLRQARFLVITYGTSFVYARKENGSIVSNCHKLPAALFEKDLLTQKKILESFEALHKSLMAFNPDLQMILTVSPVRHIKDTLQLNAVSKSILRLTTHTLASQFENVHYFPAYEILLDDLRDYRFYADDLIHPSPAAVEYIWQRFTETYFSPEAVEFVTRWDEIRKSLAHRPFNPESAQHQQFLKNTIAKLNELKNQVDVSREVRDLEQQIK